MADETFTFLRPKCGVCRKFHTKDCPDESPELIKQGLFKRELEDEPFDGTCFEPRIQNMVQGSFTEIHSFQVNLEKVALNIKVLQATETGNIALFEEKAGYSSLFKDKECIEEALSPWLYRMAKVHNLSDEEIFKAKAKCVLIVSTILSNFSPIFTFQDKKIKVEVIESDGLRIPAAALGFVGEHELVVGEISYAYAVVKKYDKEGKNEEYETIEPVLAFVKYRDGMLVERRVDSLRFLKSLDIDGKKAIITYGIKLSTAIDTLADVKMFKSFLDGTREALTFQQLHKMISDTIAKFVDLSFEPILYDVAACWVIGTYFAEFFGVFPFFYIYASTGFGKTRFLMTLTYLSRHGFIVTDPTDPTIFRMAEGFKPTLGVDESVLGKHSWKIIRTSYKKGVRVPRMIKTSKEELVLGLFETFTPLIFAATELPTELGGSEADMSRAIFAYMEKRPDPAGRDPTSYDFKLQREELYLARLLRAVEVVQAYKRWNIIEIEGVNRKGEKVKVTLSGHLKECWQPILAIASLCGNTVLENVKQYILKYNGRQEESLYEKEKTILGALWRTVETLKCEEYRFNAKELQPALLAYEGVEDENERKTFLRRWSPERIGRVLHRMKIDHSIKDGKTVYIINLNDLVRLTEAYRFALASELIEKLNSILKNREADRKAKEHEPFYSAVEKKVEFLRKAYSTEQQTPLNISSGVSGVSGVNLGINSKGLVSSEDSNPKNTPLTPLTPLEKKSGVASQSGVASEHEPHLTTEVQNVSKPFQNSQKPPAKFYKCKTCGCGPWSTLEMAREHVRLLKGHEIEEVPADART